METGITETGVETGAGASDDDDERDKSRNVRKRTLKMVTAPT